MCEKYLEYETKLIHLQLMRITPAGAWKTGVLYVNRGRGRDHPRRCGENLTCHRKGGLVSGSPPQVRGKLYFKFYFTCIIRITPAGAGKTYASSVSAWYLHAKHFLHCSSSHLTPLGSIEGFASLSATSTISRQVAPSICPLITGQKTVLLIQTPP